MMSPGIALLAISYLGFISLGLPDTMLGVLWPDLKQSFNLSQGMLGGILLALGIGYILASAWSGSLVAWLGVGRLLTLSSTLMAVSVVGYAITPWWGGFILCALLSGLGSGAIDAGMNAFAAERFSPRHVNWLHACWGIGAMTGPLLATIVLSSGGSWRWPYLIVAAVLALMSLAFLATLSLWRQPGHTESPSLMRARHVLLKPQVIILMSLFFFYTGLEVAAGQWTYTVMTEQRGIDPIQAGIWVSIYWGSLTVGRIVFGAIINTFGSDRVLRLSMLLAVVGACLFWWAVHDWMMFIGLALLGFALAPIFPTLIARTPSRAGSTAAPHAIGFEVSAANIGVAILPGLLGLLAQYLGLKVIAPGLLAMALALLLLHEYLLRLDKRY